MQLSTGPDESESVAADAVRRRLDYRQTGRSRNGGVNGPNLLNYPVIVVLAGWLLGVRATLTLVVLTALLFLGFIWADMQGLLKPVQVANRVAGAVYLAGILVLTAAVTLTSPIANGMANTFQKFD